MSSNVEHEVLLNLNAQSATVAAGAAVPTNAPYHQASGDPVNPSSAASELLFTTGLVGRTITLPAYSITFVGAPQTAGKPGTSVTTSHPLCGTHCV